MPIISILMPSYNKGKYIAQALNSVFMQTTQYTYDIIVADDASTDNTISIIEDYQKQYPGIITLLRSDINKGLFSNILTAYTMLKAKYFCVLDPDDYWTCPHKLQNAIDFLESNKGHTIYASNSAMSDTGEPFVKTNLQEKDSSFEDYLHGKAILASTQGTVYRNIFFCNGIPQKLQQATGTAQEAAFRADSLRNIIHLHEGKAHFVNTVESVYRVTEEGLWQGSNELKRQNHNCLFFYSAYDFFDKKYPELYNMAYRFFKISRNIIFDHIANEATTTYTQKDLENFLQNLRIFMQQPPVKETIKLNLKNKIRMRIYKRLHNRLKRKLLI